MLVQAPSSTTTSTTQRPMPTLAAVPSQRPPTRRNKRPNTVNEVPATVRVHHAQPDQIWRIIDQQANVEYTIYTFNVNIQSIDPTLNSLSLSLSLTLSRSHIHSHLLFLFLRISKIHISKYVMASSITHTCTNNQTKPIIKCSHHFTT